MTDAAKPANLPEPHYTPEKGGWRVATGSPPNDYAGQVLDRDGARGEHPDVNIWSWCDCRSGDGIIAYLAKPACICIIDAFGGTFAHDPDCPACNRVGEGDAPCTDCGDTGITIQTERRCACQPPFVQEEPADPVATARARCEAAGLVVIEPRTEVEWRDWAKSKWIAISDALLTVHSLGLIAPEVCAKCGGTQVRENLDGDDLCQSCCDKWVRGEGDFARHSETETADARRD